MNIYLKLILFFLVISPIVGYTAPAVTTYYELVERISSLFNISLYVMMSFSVLFIAYEAYLYIVAGSDSTKKSDAKSGITYGIFALFVMISVWGLVSILILTVFSGAGSYEAPIEGPGSGDIRLLRTI